MTRNPHPTRYTYAKGTQPAAGAPERMAHTPADKRLSAIALLTLVLSLGGCTSVPSQRVYLSHATDTDKQPTRNCDGTRLLHGAHPPRAHALTGTDFTLLNWNIHKAQHAHWPRDFARLSKEATLITLQEALLEERLLEHIGQQAPYWGLAGAFHYRKGTTGVLTASRVQAVYHCALRSTEPLIRTPKTILISRFEIRDAPAPLLLVNVHGINFSLGTGRYREQLQALQELLMQHHGPLIVAGDFNTWNKRRDARVQDMVRALSLQALPYAEGERSRILGRAVDHIFYRGVTVLEQRTAAQTSSDHHPIEVRFRFTPARLSLQADRQP